MSARWRQRFRRRLNLQGREIMKRAIFAWVLLVLGGWALAQNADRQLLAPTTRPATTQAATQPAYEIIIDCQVADLKEWSESLRPIVEKWYPIIVQTLPSEGNTAPRKFTITIRE